MTKLSLDYYEQQGDFFWETKNNVAFAAGIGSGKSLVGCDKAAFASLGQIGDMKVPTPNVGVITAPTYRMLQDATMNTFFERWSPYVRKFHRGDKIATMKNGSQIYFRSASEPDKLRGPNILWWFGDEAALYHKKVWTVMSGRTRQFGMYGWRWLATSPRGRNWVWKEFVQNEREDYRLINAPTWANPFVSEKWIADLISSYSEDEIDQELLGLFLANAGIIYSEFNRDRNKTSKQWSLDEFSYIGAGVDFGFNNPFAIEVVGLLPDGEKVVLHEEYHRKYDEDEQMLTAKQVFDTYGVQTFWCDPSGAKAIQKFQEAGLNAQPADNSVLHGINVVKRALKVPRGAKRPNLLISSEAVNLMSEMEQYEWMVNADGIRDQPKKAFDHAADALRYCLVGFETMTGSGMMGSGVIDFA